MINFVVYSRSHETLAGSFVCQNFGSYASHFCFCGRRRLVVVTMRRRRSLSWSSLAPPENSILEQLVTTIRSGNGHRFGLVQREFNV